jgi:hypothetical protein
MVDAAETAAFAATEVERSAAMRTALAEQSDLARAVAERDEILAEDPHADRRRIRTGEIGRLQDRQPVLPEEVAHERPRSDARQGFVVLDPHGSRRLTPATIPGPDRSAEFAAVSRRVVDQVR